jgi:RHS repeat-associated protein
VTQETLGNGVITNRSYDAVTGWVNSLQSGLNGSSALQNESYLFDAVGNLTQRQNNNVGLNEDFFYDPVYRMDHSTLNGTLNLQMVYDAMGNISSRSDVAAGATWTYDPSRKHAVAQAGSPSFAYTYDVNGNVTSRNGSSITWTSYNHPVTINSGSESVQFAYDHNHARYSAVYTGSTGLETTYFIGELLEKVISAGSIDYRHYIYANGTKIGTYSRTSPGANTLRYIREDHLGGVSCMVNSDGSSYVKESFTAFGNRRSACTWSGSPTGGQSSLMSAASRRGFTWQTMLGTMGLNDMTGRIEDAVIGRFLSADPAPVAHLDTQSFNRYSYARNNPLTFVDPSGFGDLVADQDNGGTYFRDGGHPGGPTGSFIPGYEPIGLSCFGNCGGTWSSTEVHGTDENGKAWSNGVAWFFYPNQDNGSVGSLTSGNSRFNLRTRGADGVPLSQSSVGSSPLQAPQGNQPTSEVTVQANRMVPCDQLNGANDTIQPLLDAANKAYNEYPLRPIDMVWPLSALRGTYIHSYFAAEVTGLGAPYSAEVSYWVVCRYRMELLARSAPTPPSVRLTLLFTRWS